MKLNMKIFVTHINSPIKIEARFSAFDDEVITLNKHSWLRLPELLPVTRLGMPGHGLHITRASDITAN